MIAGKYDIQDALSKIPPNEPVFLIRGQDIIGSAVVRFWATLNRLMGGSSILSVQAEEMASKMDDWEVKKKAD